MDRLEKFVQKNIDEFSDQTPSNDIWNKIAANTEAKKRFRIAPYAIRWAAAILVVIGIGIGAKTLLQPNGAVTSEPSLTSEVYEAAMYYETQINQKQNKIFQLTSNQPEVQEGLNQDMALLDSAMMDIKKDLKDNVANQEVIEAMIQNYRLKLQILEDILSYVDDKNNQPQTIETHEL